MQESKKQWSGDVEKFVAALSSKFIEDASLHEIKEVLRRAMVKAGLRANNFPNGFETLFLYEHITQNYPGNRLDEIKLAFEMAVMGTLNDETGKPLDANCYENFSCGYFSKIMNAYRRWASEEYRMAVKDKPPPQRIFTDTELDDSAREMVQIQFKLFLSGNEVKFPQTNEAILLKDGLLNPGESVVGLFNRKAEQGHTNIYTKE